MYSTFPKLIPDHVTQDHRVVAQNTRSSSILPISLSFQQLPLLIRDFLLCLSQDAVTSGPPCRHRDCTKGGSDYDCTYTKGSFNAAMFRSWGATRQQPAPFGLRGGRRSRKCSVVDKDRLSARRTAGDLVAILRAFQQHAEPQKAPGQPEELWEAQASAYDFDIPRTKLPKQVTLIHAVEIQSFRQGWTLFEPFSDPFSRCSGTRVKGNEKKF